LQYDLWKDQRQRAQRGRIESLIEQQPEKIREVVRDEIDRRYIDLASKLNNKSSLTDLIKSKDKLDFSQYTPQELEGFKSKVLEAINERNVNRLNNKDSQIYKRSIGDYFSFLSDSVQSRLQTLKHMLGFDKMVITQLSSTFISMARLFRICLSVI
jgi:hypothetical protein